ncbi:MAG: hypothetical protein IKV59_07155 [Lachnospiraceae bacterium]|nr:hypothetical protein [Lachnospiraceae bacterium]
MASEHMTEKEKMEHFRETMDRLTAASHVKVEYFAKHQKIEGYYEEVLSGKFFKCDRLMLQENMFSRVQLGYNPNRERIFLFANMKTSRYDTVASKYQKEMKDYQKRSLLKGDNENRAYVSKRREKASVLIEKKEPKPWTERSVKAYLGRTNMEAAAKSLPFFSREEELEELRKVKIEMKEIQKDIRDRRVQKIMAEDQAQQESEEKKREAEIRGLRQMALEDLQKENLLEAILTRKYTAAKAFVRKINYAYDFQKKDIESYYREKRKTLEDVAESADAADDRPEDEER